LQCLTIEGVVVVHEDQLDFIDVAIQFAYELSQYDLNDVRIGCELVHYLTIVDHVEAEV
jgi:hypothetical protein